MNWEEEFRLSFYKKIAAVDERHAVELVQHTDTGKIYVKKTLTHYDKTVYEIIMKGRYHGIPKINELIEADGKLIVIEDYISGRSLYDLLSVRLFTESETIRIVSQLCDILEPLHANNPPVVHRDIKDSNIIMDNHNELYLIDFDASRIITSGKSRDTELIGTEGYAAPEQYGFGQSDQRTDIYSIGILMNKLLTGKFPSEQKYTGPLGSIIACATQLEPGNRYQSVRMLKIALLSSGTNSFGIKGNDIDQMHYSVNEYGDDNELYVNKRLYNFLSRLPYPLRELPGFRSGIPSHFIAAVLWFAFLVYSMFFAGEPDPGKSPATGFFYDTASFMTLFAASLYAGNYLGIRDMLPWHKTQRRITEIIRICCGVIAAGFAVIAVFGIVAVILDI